MLKIRRPLGRLIFNMGITIPCKTVFLIETAPCYSCWWKPGSWTCSSHCHAFNTSVTYNVSRYNDAFRMSAFNYRLYLGTSRPYLSICRFYMSFKIVYIHNLHIISLYIYIYIYMHIDMKITRLPGQPSIRGWFDKFCSISNKKQCLIVAKSFPESTPTYMPIWPVE